MAGRLLGSAVAVNPRSPQGRGTRGVDGDSASRAKWRTPSDASRRNAADRTPSASNWIDPRVKPENPRQPVRHEVVTHVSGTICYLCVRAGHSDSHGGEGVSQLPLKDKAFLTFLGQNLPFELRPKTGVSPPIFSWNPSWLIQVLAQPFDFRRRWTAGLIDVCPPKAKITRSNRVGRTIGPRALFREFATYCPTQAGI